MFVARTPPRLFTLVILAGLSVLSLNMFLPSLPHIARDCGVDYALAALAIAGYLATTAVLMLILGPLSDRFGRRPVLLGSLALFTLASVVCVLAEDFRIFLLFRLLQGAVIAGWLLSMASIRDTMAPREAAARMGYLAMAMAVAPMLGPMIGGGLPTLLAIMLGLSLAGLLLGFYVRRLEAGAAA